MDLMLTILLVSVIFPSISGHGLVIEPPGRNTIWREGFQNPANFDDMGLNCGGLPNQVANGGKCGVCGDPYQGPLKHESGYPGGYANGLVGRTYKQGDTVTFTAKITANHLGYIVYKLCPINDNSAKLTQDCFDRYPLSDVNGQTKISVSDAIGRSAGLITTQMRLPPGLTCTQCVVQWTYKAGNNNGDESTPQEHFVNCADVSITIEGGSQPKPTIAELRRRTGGVTKYDENKRSEGLWDCNVVEPFNKGENHQKFYDWCITHCLEVEPRDRECPTTHCQCYQAKAASDNSPQPPKDTNNPHMVTEVWPETPGKPAENQKSSTNSERSRSGGNENNLRTRNRNQRNQRFMMNWK